MDDAIQLLISTAPVLGGLVLGVLAVNFFKGPDIRGSVKEDLDLLDRLPAEQTQRRAELQRSIDLRVDELIGNVERSHAMRDAATSHRRNWRAAALFVFAVMFTYIWWGVDHTRSDWASMFAILILLSVSAFLYAALGALRAIGSYRRDRRHTPHSTA